MLKIEYDDSSIKDDYYTKNELKKIFHNTNFLSDDSIQIKKID